MDKITGFVDGLKACEKSIKGEIREGKDRDVVKSLIQKAIEHLKQMTLHSHTLQDEISIDSRLISKTVFICHDIISHTGPMLGDDTLLFINAFCTMLSKNNKMKLAEKYLANCDSLLTKADREVKFIIGINRLSTLVVLKRYEEAISLATSLIQRLEVEVLDPINAGWETIVNTSNFKQRARILVQCYLNYATALMLEFSSDRSSLENALRVLGKAQTLFGKVIDDKALENRVENMLQECITMTFSTKTVTDSTPRTIKKGSETPHRFSIFADKKSPHKHAMGYNDKFKSLKTNSGSQYMIKTQRGRPQSSHKESSPLIHSSKSKHLKVANIHSEYFVQVGAGKMTLNKMRSYQTEKGTKERLPASFQDHGRVSRDTSFKVNTAENSYFKNGDRKRPSTSRGDVDKDCGECSRRDSIFKREQESKTKSIAVTRKSDSNSVKISDPVVQEGKAERKLRYHHLLETVKNQEREIEVLRLQQAANAVASKEIATLITQLATMNQQNRQSPTQGHHVFQNQDGPYPAIQIMHPDNSYYGQSGGQSMQAHMYIQGSMMDRIYYQQHSEYPTMDARQGVYQDMSSDPNAMYDSQPTLAPKYGRDRMDDSTIVKRGKRLLNFPLQLNVRRLRDSILAESLTVSQSILLFVGIARLSLTARKDEFDQLTISLRAQYIRKLGSAYEIDVDLLNDNGHSKKDYMLRGSDYNEIDFFKFVNKLPNYCVDIAPYDQLMSDHLEYLLTKVLRYFIIINMNDEDMYMQPVLSKSLVPINEDKKISLKFCGVQFGVELLHRNANSFFVNFMSETHHIRSHLYMDWETFDCYFDYYHDEQDPKQMASLLNTIVDGEEIDRDALKRDFTHREISVDRADLSDTGQFEDLLKDMMVKAAYIVEADFSWSFESSNEIYFCVKALNSPLENYVIMVFVNDSLEKKITVTYYYCYSLMCNVDTSPQMEKKDIPYEYFSKTYGIKFDKLSFERKKFFFEHLVMRSCCKHSQKERLEASYININDASNSPRVNYSQETNKELSNTMLDISQAKINPLNKTMIKKVQLQFELELEEVSIVKFKRTFRGKKYRYPIVMSCLAIMQMGVQVPIGIRISVYEVASISSKNLFLSISPAEWYHNKNYDEFFNFWDNFKGWNCFFKRLGFNEGQELIIKDQAKLELLSNDEYAFDSFERILHATLCAPKKS